LVDAVNAARGHGHDDGPAAAPVPDAGAGQLSGRARTNKLVHLGGDPSLVGRVVTVRIEHAGPYSLRGALVGS
jgi:tRNA A37 methylthiotransferase MiaB